MIHKMVTLEAIIYYLFFIDATVVNLIAWFAQKWYKKTFKKLSRFIPLSKIWCALYLFLVLWLGFTLYRLNIFFN